VVFLGYGLSDPNIQFIYNDVLFDQKGMDDSDIRSLQTFSQIRPSFFVSHHKIRGEEKAYYRHKRIVYLDNYSIEGFFGELADAFEEFDRRRVDVKSRIDSDIDSYIKLCDTFGPGTDPRNISVPPEGRKQFLSKISDLAELLVLLSRARSSTGFAFDNVEYNQLVGVVHGILELLRFWCSESLQSGSPEILELTFEILQTKIGVHDDWVFKSLFQMIGNILSENPKAPNLHGFVRRFCGLLSEYDDKFNTWDDYTFCLEWYVFSTRFYSVMDAATRKRTAEGIYLQLSMCGRRAGDSWYTTEKVYSIWPSFNPDAWPALEKEVARHEMHVGGHTYLSERDKAILEFLKPGGDCKLFFPRV
jgi:hypothetical protein